MISKRAIYFSRLFGFAFLSLLFCLYIAFMPCVQRKLYNLVLFQPWQYPKGDYQVRSLCGVPAQDVSFKTADGSLLHALYFKHPRAKNTVIIHHGTGMNLTLFLSYAQVFVAGESSVFIYDYRGFGKSTGSSSWNGVCEDGQAAFDYLVNTAKLPEKNVLNCGLSLGTGPATYVAANNECGGLFLACPYTSLRKVGREHLPFLCLYPDFLFPEPDINNMAIAAQIKCPVTIVHGKKDTCIGYRHSTQLFARINSPKKLYLMDKVSHSDFLCDEFVMDTLKVMQAFAKDPDGSVSSSNKICQNF